MLIDYSNKESVVYLAYEHEYYFEVIDTTCVGTRIAVLIGKFKIPVINSIVVERIDNKLSVGWMRDVHDFDEFFKALNDIERPAVQYWINRCLDLDEQKSSLLVKELKHQVLITRVSERWFKENLEKLDTASAGA